MCHVSCGMCHMSHVTCHMSHVTGHVSLVTGHLSQRKKRKNFYIKQSGGTSQLRVCYQRGLPRLVLKGTVLANFVLQYSANFCVLNTAVFYKMQYSKHWSINTLQFYAHCSIFHTAVSFTHCIILPTAVFYTMQYFTHCSFIHTAVHITVFFRRQ